MWYRRKVLNIAGEEMLSYIIIYTVAVRSCHIYNEVWVPYLRQCLSRTWQCRIVSSVVPLLKARANAWTSTSLQQMSVSPAVSSSRFSQITSLQLYLLSNTALRMWDLTFYLTPNEQITYFWMFGHMQLESKYGKVGVQQQNSKTVHAHIPHTFVLEIRIAQRVRRACTCYE